MSKSLAGDTPVKRGKSQHIADFVSSSISTDGTTALLVFKRNDGEKIAFTVPVMKLPLIRTAFHDTLCKLPPQHMGDLAFVFRSLGVNGQCEVSVSVDPVQLGDIVILRMNPDRAEEMDFALDLKVAADLVRILGQAVTAVKEKSLAHPVGNG